MKRATEMSKEEYAAARRAAVNPKADESWHEPKPVSKMTPEEYRAAKRAAGIR